MTTSGADIMANFSFDIVSEYDKGEMNNVFDQVGREIDSRYDFKGTSAGIDWLEDKKGFKIEGDHDLQIDAIIETLRKKLSTRGLSQKVIDVTGERLSNNMKMRLEVKFVAGLDQDKAKKITKHLRETHPKAKATIQGEAVRIMSGSKDELQNVMDEIRKLAETLDFPVSFTNFR
jgi:cyclic-di-GMP-binding protein